ncbi:24544_t:CDS:2 [Racocetra persica]|uniref:24544_t:CDS:1 n=1 Tax=Racocetra persica TaxID=160502 RepID=A0ACA9MHE6_9GLOM|nr:24544_t:CDS:2 [Racocetra persica]
MATDDHISKWKRNQNTDTIFFGSNRNDVIQQIRTRVRNQGSEFTDNEWNIKERPLKALYKKNDSPSSSSFFKYDPKMTMSKRIQNQNRRFYAGVRGRTSPDDVKQGQIGDCWYLAVLSGAAQVEGLINSIAVEYNENLGKNWIGTVVDDYLFYNSNSNELVFSDGNVTWVPLLESKSAFAKIHYSYESLDGNWPSLALTSLGADGLVGNHVYTILRAVNFHSNMLVKIRNPWANTEWKGRWADSDQIWWPWTNKGTSTRINELDYSFGNDGTFFMEYQDLLSNFSQIDGREYPLTVDPNLDITNHLTSSWWNGQYSIFYTDRMNQPDLSTIELTFLGQHPNNWISLVSASGKDGLGPYIIEQGQHNLSSKTITFIKRYINCNNNAVWHYQGIYSHKMFFGNWGTPSQPNLGKFIIRRVPKIEKQSLTGKWCGYYFYNPNNGNDLMSIDLTVQSNPAGGNTIFGSNGIDKVGKFTIQGHMSVNGSVNFTKQYVAAQSWIYNGLMRRSEMWGTWGNNNGFSLCGKTSNLTK